MPLAVDLADYVLGTLLLHDLPEVCCRALEEGYHSTSLAALAGSPKAAYNPWEVEELWHAALRELQLSLPNRADAAEVVVDDAIAQALSGRATPAVSIARIVEGAYYASGASLRDAGVAGDSLRIEAAVGVYWMYAELGEAWAPTKEELDRDALEILRRLRNRVVPSTGNA